jgi:hypothetical protein
MKNYSQKTDNQIIDAEKLIGPINMNYDWVLSEQEAINEDPYLYSLKSFFTIPSPSQIEQKLFESGLSKIK